MRILKVVPLLALVALFLVRCDDQVVAPEATLQQEIVTDVNDALSKNGPPTSATMIFGREVGSPFPPPDGHDRSTHAKDSMVPRTAVISRGGSVTFRIGPFHRAAIYEPGTEPEDIDTSALVDLAVPFPIPGFVIDDPNGRIAVAWPNPQELMLAPAEWTFTFDAPGRYLIICTTTPHFVDNDMWGWVIVK